MAPAELEAHLLGHEQVADACVVQKHCDRAGELPKAYVVPKDKATADKEKIRSDVNSHVCDQLALFKTRAAFFFVLKRKSRP